MTRAQQEAVAAVVFALLAIASATADYQWGVPILGTSAALSLILMERAANKAAAQPDPGGAAEGDER